jgi:hypothetical protein
MKRKLSTLAVGMTLLAHIALVKAVLPPPRFTVDGTGGVADARTGLIWQRDVSPSTYTWSDAKMYCATLHLANTTWRLPAYKELTTLVDRALRSSPMIDTQNFPQTPAEPFWSATVYADANMTGYWHVNFGDGTGSHEDPSAPMYRVRCVH